MKPQVVVGQVPSINYCWGARHVSPTGDLYLHEIPEIGCLVAADERFHWWFDYGSCSVWLLVGVFMSRSRPLVPLTELVLIGMNHLVEILLGLVWASSSLGGNVMKGWSVMDRLGLIDLALSYVPCSRLFDI